MDKAYLIQNNPYNNLLQTAILSKVAHRGAVHNATATSLCPCSKHYDLGAIVTIKMNMCVKRIQKL